MIIDTSAVVAVLAKEPDRPRVVAALTAAVIRRTIPIVRLEAAMVLSTLIGVEPVDADAAVSRLFEEAAIEVLPITDTVAQAAVVAFERYGKGRGHPARLNLADCLVYAAAKTNSSQLLFIGDDFSRTDIESVLDDPRPIRA